MDHSEATRNLVVEQYILGELGERQRDEFENHFFDCPECAEDVKAAAILVANLKVVFRESATENLAAVSKRIQWLPFAGWGFAPAASIAACAILGVLVVLVSYQNLLQIPDIRAHVLSTQLVLMPAISVRSGRAQQGLTFSKRNGIMSVTVAHEWEETYSRYEVEIERASDHQVISKAETAATPSDIAVLAGLQGFGTGSYFLNLYGIHTGSIERIPVARVPLTLTE
jgi:Putative zinc-finger